MEINNPGCTYRIQFHQGFSFDAFERAIHYLEKLGVQTVYASPVFKSVPGSNHGYDGLDPLVVNPEIGSVEQLKKIIVQLKQNGMGWLQDIVPNHMAFHPGNDWLMDVLEKGKRH
jgi:maltooligosyltrehalose synthase